MGDIIKSEKVLYDCPFCDKEHIIEIRTQYSKMLIKNEPVEFIETVYYCSIEDDEFAPGKVVDENILTAKDVYRKMKNLLTSGEIIDIRRCYDLTQKELSNLLGWGGTTIKSYETKLIQDETHDNILRMVYNEPIFALDLLEKHKTQFAVTRYNEIRTQCTRCQKTVQEDEK